MSSVLKVKAVGAGNVRKFSVRAAASGNGGPTSGNGATPSPGPDPFDRHHHGRDRVTPDSLDRHSSARDRANAGRQSERANVNRPGTNKGSSFQKENRRRGRPAHLRSPDDSPMRDGNRDRLIGLLTERASKTLLVYLQETNPTVYSWLWQYMKETPIPLQGNWDEISGEVFLRKMLAMPPGVAKIALGRDELFDNVASSSVDPRQMAQRIMDIREQLSREFVQDLGYLKEENTLLLRETLQVSLTNVLSDEPMKEEDLPPLSRKVFVHPELLERDGSLHPDIAESHPELASAIKRQNTPPPAPSPSSSPPSASSSSTLTTTSPPNAPSKGASGAIFEKPTASSESQSTANPTVNPTAKMTGSDTPGLPPTSPIMMGGGNGSEIQPSTVQGPPTSPSSSLSPSSAPSRSPALKRGTGGRSRKASGAGAAAASAAKVDPVSSSNSRASSTASGKSSPVSNTGDNGDTSSSSPSSSDSASPSQAMPPSSITSHPLASNSQQGPSPPSSFFDAAASILLPGPSALPSTSSTQALPISPTSLSPQEEASSTTSPPSSSSPAPTPLAQSEQLQLQQQQQQQGQPDPPGQNQQQGMTGNGIVSGGGIVYSRSKGKWSSLRPQVKGVV